MIESRAAIDDDVAATEEIGRITWPATYAFAGEDYISDGLARWWSRAALLDSMRDTTVLMAVDGGRVRLEYVDGNKRAASIYAAKGFRRTTQGTG